jgi:UDP-N-acetylmuramoyl-L-alanyl-D-glutamate--2,6-diaminopimelate ligase
VAVAGECFDGLSFVGEAIDRGAAAVLAASDAEDRRQVAWLTTQEPRMLLGPLAARLFDHPERQLKMAGVTGTNGKSTVVALLRSVFEAAGIAAGDIGTLGYRFRDHHFAGERTTPEASDLFRILGRMRDLGAGGVAMEVSSHALSMGRVEGAAFDVAIFTNLSRDHLDFHGDLESYFAAKRSLMRRLKPDGRAVVNLDDPFGRRLAEEIPAAFTFGGDGEVRPEGVRLHAGGIAGALRTPAGPVPLESPLLGSFNLQNLTAAAAGAVALGLPLSAVEEGLSRVKPLAGRMEPVEKGQPFRVLIDYAHTPAALSSALAAIREFSDGRIIVVFGCGGDRDEGKRPLMGRIAGEAAELPILTSDNPRSEDPAKILAEAEAGLAASGNRSYRVISDRRRAIREAISEAAEGDVVLIAGKGHERVQIVGGQELPFSDHEEAEAALEQRFG